MKAGLIIAGAPFCAEALFDGRAAADDEKLAEDTPIGPREIVKGLDGMSRVAETGNTFGLGHNAAAVISSAFFCREQKLDADTQKEILAYLDARLLKNPIYAGFTRHEAERFPGEHAAILEPVMFDRVQSMMGRLPR